MSTTEEMVVNRKSLKMATNAPARKVAAGGLAGAVTTLVVFVLNTYVLPPDKLLTGEIVAAITTLLSFAVAYFARPGTNDMVVEA